MAPPSFQMPPDSVPSQIWTQLDPERQLQAIRLLARMAANLAATQPEAAPTEVSHALTTELLQGAF